jgi:hypothetical protein
MIDASEGAPYRLADPRAAKPVIESKHQLRGMPGRSSVISEELQAGEIAYLCTGELYYVPFKSLLISTMFLLCTCEQERGG